jgi:hypothetical protein
VREGGPSRATVRGVLAEAIPAEGTRVAS